MAWMQSLAKELLHAAGAAIKRKIKIQKKKKKKLVFEPREARLREPLLGSLVAPRVSGSRDGAQDMHYNQL